MSSESNESGDQLKDACDGEGHCGRHWRWKRRFGWTIPFFVVAFVLIKSGLVLALWNALIPEVFHGPTLTFVQAIELTVLAKLLVGFGHHWGHHHHGPFMKRHWMALSDEERQKLRAEFKHRWKE